MSGFLVVGWWLWGLDEWNGFASLPGSGYSNRGVFWEVHKGVVNSDCWLQKLVAFGYSFEDWTSGMVLLLCLVPVILTGVSGEVDIWDFGYL